MMGGGPEAATNINYGERYRNGERIGTGFAESTVTHVVSKRMVKKQQMQWTPEGAHLLLQVRTQVLNGDWEETFRTWYPQFRRVPVPGAATREAASSPRLLCSPFSSVSGVARPGLDKRGHHI